MMGCLPMDKKLSSPSPNSIIWADTRSQKQADELGERYGVAEFYQTTGHPAFPLPNNPSPKVYVGEEA